MEGLSESSTSKAKAKAKANTCWLRPNAGSGLIVSLPQRKSKHENARAGRWHDGEAKAHAKMSARQKVRKKGDRRKRDEGVASQLDEGRVLKARTSVRKPKAQQIALHSLPHDQCSKPPQAGSASLSATAPSQG